MKTSSLNKAERPRTAKSGCGGQIQHKRLDETFLLEKELLHQVDWPTSQRYPMRQAISCDDLLQLTCALASSTQLCPKLLVKTAHLTALHDSCDRFTVGVGHWMPGRRCKSPGILGSRPACHTWRCGRGNVSVHPAAMRIPT